MQQSPFSIRGLVEGFYGSFYTFPERNELIGWLGRHGYNLYIYGPKNDRQHRERWREPYPARVMAQFARTVSHATKHGVTFCYALSPNTGLCYSSAEDFAHITTKLHAFFAIGVRAFSILFDDIHPAFQHAADQNAYASFADAHADLSNRVYEWLQTLDPTCSLSMCPTDYHGSAPWNPYVYQLGKRLHEAIDVFYTGPQVCSPTITSHDARSVAEALGRPPLIWDNYPVNDLAMQTEMHIGPIRGRDAALAASTRGIVINPMIQAEASKVALATYADFFADPQHYEAEPAWERALAELAGVGYASDLRLFAENVLRSCMDEGTSSPLAQHTAAALLALAAGEKAAESEQVRVLEAYLVSLDEASYQLKNRMQNLALRNNLLPWLEAMDTWQELGRSAIAALRATPNESGSVATRQLRELTEAATRHPRQLADHSLLELAAQVIQ